MEIGSDQSSRPGASDPVRSAESEGRAPVRSHLTRAILVALLVVYGIFLIKHASYAVGGADSSAYASLARTILRGKVKLPIKELDQFGHDDNLAGVFTPIAFYPLVTGNRLTREMISLYPIGFPLHIAATVQFAGWKLGPFIIAPLLGALSCALIYLVGIQLGLSRAASLTYARTPIWRAMNG